MVGVLVYVRVWVSCLAFVAGVGGFGLWRGDGLLVFGWFGCFLLLGGV